MNRLLAGILAALSLIFTPAPALAQMSFSFPSRAVIVQCQSAVAVPLTGTTAETTLATCAIPANAMGANGRLQIKARFSTTNNANNKTFNIKFGSTMFTTKAAASIAVFVVDAEIANRNATNSQVGGGQWVYGGNATAVAASTGTEDTTTALNLLITVTNANAGDTSTLESYQVIIFPKS